MNSHQKKLLDDLSQMRSTIEEDMDLTFVCFNRTIKASSHIVKARCDPIKSILNNGKEGKQKTINLTITMSNILVDLCVGTIFVDYIIYTKNDFQAFSLGKSSN